jgi:TonB family protein
MIYWSRFASVALAAVTLLLARGLPAQQPTATTAADAYPNTSEALSSLIGNILQAAHEGNSAKESELVRSLVFPGDSTWFTTVYGPGFGASLASAYRREAPQIEERIKGTYEANVKRGWMTPKILRYADPESVNSPIDHFLNCMDQVVPLYQTAFQGNSPSFYGPLGPGSNMKFGAGDLDGYFTYDQGGFRFIPQDVLMMLPSERPVRIKLDFNVMRSKVITLVNANAPTEAVKKRMSGKVVVQVVLDTGGKIKELKVLEGNPILSAAVVEAVKQWQFAPTRLDGDPVEVELDIPYAFEFH